MSKVATRGPEARGLDDGIKFFNSLCSLVGASEGQARSHRETRHIVDSLLEWLSSPQNNTRTSTE